MRFFEANRLFLLVYSDRSEAVKRNAIVTICKSNNANQCGGEWTNGWIVFTDVGKDGSRDSGEILILSEKLSEGYRLEWTAFRVNNYIRFTTDGLTISQNGSYKICPTGSSQKFARAVVITTAASVHLQ